MSLNRRTFLATASGLAVGTRLAASTVQGANDRIRIGVIGTGGRARSLMGQLKTIAGARMTAVCDVYEPRMLQAAEIAGGDVLKVSDYRRILDNREIDAVLVATPDHWHKRITLDAVAAGKDVYVEKPVSHSVDEGAEMVAVIEASKQIVQTGTQQRSWKHWMLGKALIDDGTLGQVTFVHTYWYQHARAGNYAPVDMTKLDWTQWLGSAPAQPFRPERFYQWRHYWDFGGGCLTDLMTHWIDVVHWYMNVEAPIVAQTMARSYNLTTWEAPDTVSTAIEFPRKFMCAYLGTYVSRVDDGGLEFRGEKGTLKIDRSRLAFYRDDAPYAAGSLTPEPEIVVRSSGDGTVAHLQNWVDCIRSRKTPNSHIRVAHQAARTAHLANASLRAGRPARWNDQTQRLETS